MKNFCFICGISRGALEKNNFSFEEHTQEAHFIWNYIFFIYCLLNKDSTEYTGLEYWLHDKLIKDDISWFPIQEVDGVADVQDRLNEIKKQLEILQGMVEEKAEDKFNDIIN